MALKKLDKHQAQMTPSKYSLGEWTRSTIHVESTEPEARVHPHKAHTEDARMDESGPYNDGKLRLVPADEEERSEAAIDGALGHKVADDES
jgi:hypothetical protein